MDLYNVFLDACYNKNLTKIKNLVEKRNLDIHSMNDYGFRNACKRGYLNVVKLLVEEYDTNIHVMNEYGFRWSCEKGHVEVVKYLVEKGADIHACNEEGFQQACYNGHLSIVKYLVEKGADIYLNNEYGLRYACYNGHLNIVKYLVEKGAHPELLYNEYNIHSDIKSYLETLRKQTTTNKRNNSSQFKEETLNHHKNSCNVCLEKNKCKILIAIPCCNLGFKNDHFLCDSCWKKCNHKCPQCRKSLPSIQDALIIHYNCYQNILS